MGNMLRTAKATSPPIASEAQPTTSAFIDFETISDDSPVPPGPVGSWYLSQNVTFYELGYGSLPSSSSLAASG